MARSAHHKMPLSSSKLADWVCYHESNAGCRKRKDSPLDPARSSSGMKGKRACEDGQTARVGVQVASQARF